VSDKHHAPATLSSGKLFSVPIVQKGELGPERLWSLWRRKEPPTPARKESTVHRPGGSKKDMILASLYCTSIAINASYVVGTVNKLQAGHMMNR
jgi:hypothetical protein